MIRYRRRGLEEDEQYQVEYGSLLGFLVDSEIVLSTRYGKTRVFINKNFINRDLHDHT